MIIYFVLAITLFTGQNIAFKLFSQRFMRTKPSYFLFSSIYFACICLLFLIIGVDAARITPTLAWLSLLFATSFISAMFLYMKAMEHGPLGLSFLFFSAGMLVPIIFGIVFYGEPAPIYKVAGLAMMFGAFYISASGDGEKKVSKKWVVYVASGMVCNGFIGVAMKLFRLAAPPEAVADFLFLAFGVGSCIALAAGLALAFVFKEGARHFKSPVFIAIAAGAAVSTCFGNYIMVFMSLSVSALVQFPVISGALVITSILVSRFIFREEVTRKHLLSIGIGLVSIVTLSL